MYKEDPEDPLSYFQVAGKWPWWNCFPKPLTTYLGIHGKPFIEWNGAGKLLTDGWPGYCPHGVRVFLLRR